MFTHSLNSQNTVRKAGLTGVPRQQDRAGVKQYQQSYLFQSQPSQKNKSLCRHVAIVNQFISQIMRREAVAAPSSPPAEAVNNQVRQVRGIADRLPRLVDPDNPEPAHDSIFLGDAKDYPAPVLAIEYNDMIRPVCYEGNQVIARYLYLDCSHRAIQGQLILSDGSRLPVEIMVFTAV